MYKVFLISLSLFGFVLFGNSQLALAENKIKFPCTATVVAQDAQLLSAPSYQAKVLRSLQLGEKLVIVERVRSFYLVKDEATGSFLFVDQFAIEFSGEVPKEHRKKNYLREDVMRLGFPSPEFHFGRNGSPHKRRDTPYDGYAKGKTYPTRYSENIGYVPKANGREILSEAKKFLGVPYKLGGEGPSAIDCSGLVVVALRKQGIQLPRRASLQAQYGRMVRKDELQIGDLVFFKDSTDPGFLSHVGIYAGGGMFLHASANLGKVGYSSLSEPYYAKKFAFGRRL